MVSDPASSLGDQPLRELLDLMASDAPTPGGGSAAALSGAVGAALVRMVLNLTAGREQYAEHQQTVRELSHAAAGRQAELLSLVDLDASAYAAVMQARQLPRDDARARKARSVQLRRATVEATRVPLRTVEVALEVARLAERVAAFGNRHAVSDAGVGAELAAAAAHSAALNVRINLPYLPENEPLRTEAEPRLASLLAEADACRRRTASLVAARMAEEAS